MLDTTQFSLEEIYKLAEDENTPQNILECLSEEKNKDILQRIANNPNTPISILEKLSQYFPDEVINNPVCNLLYLENSQQMDFLKIAMAKSKFTSEAKLIELAKNSDSQIHNALLDRKNLSVEVLNIIVSNSNEYIYTRIASSENTPIEILEKLTNISARYVRSSVAQNKSTPAYILERLANDSDMYVRSVVAENKNTSVNTLSKLATDSYSHVRESVAKNNKTPKEIIKNLKINSSKQLVDQQANKQPQKTIGDLSRLAIDRDFLVRKMVANNSNTPINILKKLIADNNPQVRNAVAGNKNVPKDIIQRLDDVDKIKFLNFYWKCEANDVNKPLTLDISIFNSDFNDISKSMVMLLMRSFTLSYKTQQELIDYDGINQTPVRIGLAQNEDLSPPIIAQLVRDRSKLVRQEIAKNINIPVIYLILLAGDMNLSVRKTITNCTIYDQQVPVALLEYLAKNSYWLIRRKIANLLHTPVHILEQLASDECEYVRMGVAYNINSPDNIFEKLKQDSSKHVRLSAAKRLNNDALVLEYFAKDTESKKDIKI